MQLELLFAKHARRGNMELLMMSLLDVPVVHRVHILWALQHIAPCVWKENIRIPFSQLVVKHVQKDFVRHLKLFTHPLALHALALALALLSWVSAEFSMMALGITDPILSVHGSCPHNH